jgi:hypothetical protein
MMKDCLVIGFVSAVLGVLSGIIFGLSDGWQFGVGVVSAFVLTFAQSWMRSSG